MWYGGSLTGSSTQDIQVVGSLEAHTGSDVSGVSSWLEPTSFSSTQHVNLCFCHAHAVHHTHLSVPEKAGSAAHSSTSTTSTELQCHSVGAQVHLVWLELQVVTCDHHHHQHFPCIMIIGALGGCQLEPCSPKHELESTSVATQVFKCDHRKVSREQCPLTTVGLPVVCDIDMQLAWHVSCLQPRGKDILG